MAEADPYPSGGSAVAQVAALAASLAASAADRSRRWEEAGGARAQAQALHRRAVELAQRADEAYAVARQALSERGLGAGTEPADEHQQARDWQLGVAVEQAARPPLELAAKAADIAELAGVIALRGADDVRADAVIAAELAAAAARAAARLVRINLVVGRDPQLVAVARSYAEAAAGAAASADAIDL
jgi:formiminotetrahydrofolate cyclodeaminase